MMEARKEELRLKKQKSRKYLEWLIDGKLVDTSRLKIGMTRDGRIPIHLGPGNLLIATYVTLFLNAICLSGLG